MPYIITTRPGAYSDPAETARRWRESGRADGEEQARVIEGTRRAVATLEDACAPFAVPPENNDESTEQRYARAAIYDYLRLWDDSSPALALPDGTVIEVKPMVNSFGRPDARGYLQSRGWHLPSSLDEAEVIAAFNSAQED